MRALLVLCTVVIIMVIMSFNGAKSAEKEPEPPKDVPIICGIYIVTEDHKMELIQKGEDCEGLMWLTAPDGRSA